MAEKKDSLCWSCKNSVPDLAGHGCNWSRKFKPVDGWTAEYVEKNCSDGTYNVIACPEFIKDSGGFVVDPLNADRLQDLANAVVASAAKNYRSLCKAEAKIRAVPGNMTRRVLYRGKWRRLYGYEYMGLRGALNRAEKFFTSDYAKGLTEADPEWIASEIRKEAGL